MTKRNGAGLSVFIFTLVSALLCSAIHRPQPALADEPTPDAEPLDLQEMRGACDRVSSLALAEQLVAYSMPWGGSNVNDYVNRLGQKVARANGLREPQALHVLYSPEPKALALFGGFIFVNSGVLSAADSEQEFAAVIAHEMAHLNACPTSLAPKRPSLLVRRKGLSASPLVRAAKGVVGSELEASCDPEAVPKRGCFERDADRLMDEYLFRAGYDPAFARDMISRIEPWRLEPHGKDWTYRHPLMDAQPSIGENSVEGLPQMRVGREDQSEFQAARNEVLRYDLLYARLVGEPLPGEERRPRLMRRSANIGP